MVKRIFLSLALLFLIASNLNAQEGKSSKELIFARGLVPSSHASSIVELANGDLFAVWYADWVPKSAIWGSWKYAGSNKWTTPCIIHRTKSAATKNPVLYLGRDNKLFLFWGDERRFWFKIVKDTLRMKTSSDGGKTWSEPADVGNLTWFLPRTNVVTLKDGTMVLPIYTDLSTSSAVSISKDNGATWSAPRYILFFFGIQPTIIERSDSSLFALMRTGMWPRLCWEAVSWNKGWTWKGLKFSDVKNPGFSLDMIKLKSGNVVMAFNDSKKSRSVLNIALSKDDGRTWPFVKEIENDPGNVYGYPFIIQDRQGMIHVVYSYENRNSIAHFICNEEWISGQKA